MTNKTYRIMQLEGCAIYRVERWTLQWFSRGHYYWKAVKYYRYPAPSSTEFETLGSARRHMELLQAEDKVARERSRKNWTVVEVV